MTDVLQLASSARSRCRACGEPIRKGELRFGERLPNPFADGDATYWFHLRCAACTRSEKLGPLLEVTPHEIGDRELLVRVVEAGVRWPRATRLLRAERAPSGRARCRHCKQLIAGGAWRFDLGIFEDGRMEPIGFIHVQCAGAYFGTLEVLERLSLIGPGLSDGERDEISRCLHAPPPASEPAVASAPSAADRPALRQALPGAPARRSKARG